MPAFPQNCEIAITVGSMSACSIFVLKTCLSAPPTYPPIKFLSYRKYSWYVPIMIDAFVPRLPFSLRRRGGSVLPFSHIVERARIYRFSVNFLRFPRFLKGEHTSKSPLCLSSFFLVFVASCGINLRPFTCCQPEYGLTRRHKATKRKS